MNSTHDPLEKHNFALSSYTIAMGPTFENMKRSSQKKKKKKNKKGETQMQVLFNTIQT